MSATQPTGTPRGAGVEISPLILPASRLAELVALLSDEGFAVHGPSVRDGAIVMGPLVGADALPHGWTAHQEPGAYRLERRDDAAVFGFTHGAQSCKTLLHPPRLRLWSARRTADGFAVEEDAGPAKPLAIFGARACDLRAVAVQDRVLLEGAHVDAVYSERRREAFIVAVDCGEPSGTCFCVSMGSGPAATSGFDLALTELAPAAPSAHRFVVRVGSERGGALARRLGLAPATPADLREAEGIVAEASAHMGRKLDPASARVTLIDNRESAHWDDVAQRCLTCGNCTMVCPTCFCATVEDTSDLTGDVAERWRQWDSCFALSYSYIAGDVVRHSAAARYRHWISHKLANWYDQFGESGCVGCGRCITWCPVGIDITAEVSALQEESA
jgi:sulfhydrogenase subunit beta (sulfur reductase)